MGKGPEQAVFQRKYTNGQQVHEEELTTTTRQGNVNQNHSELSPHNCQDGHYKKYKQ